MHQIDVIAPLAILMLAIAVYRLGRHLDSLAASVNAAQAVAPGTE